MDYAPCVVHLGSFWTSGRPGVGRARAAAALRGGAAPACGARIARVHPVLGECAQRKEGVGVQLT